MSATATLEATPQHGHAAVRSQRMIVAWQNPETRRITPIGVLTRMERGYGFAYLDSVRAIEGFRPIVGFPHIDRQYRSDTLFHLFAQRAMSPRRPDYHRFITALGLTPEDDEPWEQLARSRGTRAVDRLQLFPVPVVQDGAVRCPFLVHGTRHVSENVIEVDGIAPRTTAAEHEQTLGDLTPGERLRLVPEPLNSFNPAAMLITSESSQVVGWVPDLLVNDLHRLRNITDVESRVLRVNGPDAPAHLRVLAELTADGAGSFEFFAGPEWLTIPEVTGQ